MKRQPLLETVSKLFLDQAWLIRATRALSAEASNFSLLQNLELHSFLGVQRLSDIDMATDIPFEVFSYFEAQFQNRTKPTGWTDQQLPVLSGFSVHPICTSNPVRLLYKLPLS